MSPRLNCLHCLFKDVYIWSCVIVTRSSVLGTEGESRMICYTHAQVTVTNHLARASEASVELFNKSSEVNVRSCLLYSEHLYTCRVSWYIFICKNAVLQRWELVNKFIFERRWKLYYRRYVTYLKNNNGPLSKQRFYISRNSSTLGFRNKLNSNSVTVVPRLWS